MFRYAFWTSFFRIFFCLQKFLLISLCFCSLVAPYSDVQSEDYDISLNGCEAVDNDDLIVFQCDLDVGGDLEVLVGAFIGDSCDDHITGDNIDVWPSSSTIVVTLDNEYEGYEDGDNDRLLEVEDGLGDDVDDAGGDSGDGDGTGVARVARGCLKIDGRKDGFTFASLDIHWTLTVNAEGHIDEIELDTDEDSHQQIYVEIQDSIGIESVELKSDEVSIGHEFELEITASEGAIITDVYNILCSKTSGDPYAYDLIEDGFDYGVTRFEGCDGDSSCSVYSVLPQAFFGEDSNSVECYGSAGLGLERRRFRLRRLDTMNGDEADHVDKGFGVDFKTEPLASSAASTNVGDNIRVVRTFTILAAVGMLVLM